jgi:hypothetical protein
MNCFRWLTLAVGVFVALANAALAQAPTVAGKDITLAKAATLESVQWINKDGTVMDDAKGFWQSTPDNLKHTLAAGAPGLFVLKLKEGAVSRVHIVQYDGTKLALISAAPSAGPAAPVAPPAPGLNLSGSSTPSAAGAAAEANLTTLKGQIKKWVLETAASWGSTGNGRENYIQRFDRTPAATCESIAKIFEETAASLADGADMTKAKDALKIRLQAFYDSQKKPLRTINPATEDWQPFLRHLDENLLAQPQFQSIDLANPAQAKFVLLELTEAFRELRAFFLDEQTSTAQGAGLGGANNSGSNTGYSNSGAGSGGSRHCRRRRCCSSLLFGF